MKIFIKPFGIFFYMYFLASNRKLLVSALLSFMILLVLSLSSVAAPGDFTVDIQETGSILDYYHIYYIVEVEGSVTITNEKNHHIYGIEIPMTVGTLSFVESSLTSYMTPEGIKIPFLEAGQSVTVDYNIFGITTVDVTEEYISDGASVFTNLMDEREAYFRSDLWIELDKGEVEKLGKRPKSREMEVAIINPTSLEYDITNIQVLRTDDEDINNPNKLWNFDDKIRIYGGETWRRSFQDTGDGMKHDSVYWFVVDHDLANEFLNLIENNDILIFDENDMNVVPGPEEPELPPGEDITKPLFTRTKVFIRKVIEPNRVFPGDIVNVTLIVTNLDVESKQVSLRDYLPDGFEIYDVPLSDFLVDRDNLRWDIVVNRDTSRVVNYAVRFIDESSIGLDYFPEAKATYDDGQANSPRVPFIKQFIPQQKLYVQKNVRRISPDVAEITISVRNLGEAELDNLVIKDYLDAENMFSEITEQPSSKGVWELPILAKDEMWVVTYKTDNHQNLQRLPLVFGIDEANVAKTLIIDNLVANSMLTPSFTFIIEIIGIIVLILFPILMILMYRKKLLDKEKFRV